MGALLYTTSRLGTTHASHSIIPWTQDMLGGVLNRMAVTARTDNSGKDGVTSSLFFGFGG